MRPFNFSRKHRLVTKKAFQAIFACAEKVKYKNWLALYCSNELTYPRLGILVSKKHISHATDRNLIKRIIRESFRHQKSSLQNLDVIVLLTTKCASLDKTQLRQDIDMLWPLTKTKKVR